MNKAVILAGGKGTRISEETRNIPKPMIRVGDKPILHHIMEEYISQGVNEFIILSGYKSEIIYGYFLSISNLVMQDNGVSTFQTSDWKVNIIYSGIESQTGGRLGRAKQFLQEDFFFTYGDGLSDIDIRSLVKFHKKNNAIATISGVRPAPRFGSIQFDESGKVLDFGEKQEHLHGWVNGGFAAMSTEIFSYIDSDDCNLEKDIYPILSNNGKLYVVAHNGFWHCVDTLRDLDQLEEIYKTNGAIWIK